RKSRWKVLHRDEQVRCDADAKALPRAQGRFPTRATQDEKPVRVQPVECEVCTARRRRDEGWNLNQSKRFPPVLHSAFCVLPSRLLLRRPPTPSRNRNIPLG